MFQGNTLKAASTKQELEEKLKKCYGEKICIGSGNNRKNNTLYDRSLSLDEAVQKRDIKGDAMKMKVRDIALLLREEIIGRRDSPQPLPINLKIEDIKRGEVAVRELVTTFFQNLIGGPHVRRWKRKNQINERGCCISF